ncbi:unnamed protein product [Arctia plantaginis]|uniref:Uncharacterized protein n=1 Tax=Arctia plantaginis TaxID=874455 RepID=A0A8S0ZQ22_ARCPL|nr:unnamed protein product [Arctia plantaginis]
MKVKLATQLFSSSVADALEFCRNQLKLKRFEDCSGTVNFINIMNHVFDVLNSHSIRPPGWKKAMCPQNIGFIRALFESTIEYLKSLKLITGELLVESRRKTGFIGLIINYEHLVEDKQILKFVPLYKISQDHLELFFSAIRARGGFNNNPNAVQFRAAYKKLLIRGDIRGRGIGNCITLEQINILTCSSKNPVNAINELSQQTDFVEIPEDDSDLYNTYMEYLETSDGNEFMRSNNIKNILTERNESKGGKNKNKKLTEGNKTTGKKNEKKIPIKENKTI